ncbi:hypothetical protein JT55_17130 [Rhodovulum sp. NI22]|nr:hypothetical protein JT55_17130 [Rhodovulum sp. NI22]
MPILLLAIGLVLVVEGLVFALAPSRLEDLLAVLKTLPLDARRALGLGAVALGVGLVWLAKVLGA